MQSSSAKPTQTHLSRRHREPANTAERLATPVPPHQKIRRKIRRTRAPPGSSAASTPGSIPSQVTPGGPRSNTDSDRNVPHLECICVPARVNDFFHNVYVNSYLSITYAPHRPWGLAIMEPCHCSARPFVPQASSSREPRLRCRHDANSVRDLASRRLTGVFGRVVRRVR